MQEKTLVSSKNEDEQKEEAEYYKWKGTIERNPDYYQTEQDRKINGLPKKHWERYKEEKGINEKAFNIFTPRGQGERFNKIQPVYYDEAGIFWLWNNELYKWQQIDEVGMLNMIEETTGQDIITPKNRTLILNTLKQQGRKNKPEEIKKTWVQFHNTIIDITTGEQFEATPKYFVTNPIPWSMGEHPDTPVMDRIFEEWVGKERVELLYEILAYCCIPDYPLNRMFCFIGGGMNGKSKYLELLVKFIGSYNCTSTELDILTTSRFEMTRLHKKLVCQMGETNFNVMSQTSRIKKLTGGDLINFEYKGKNPFDDVNYAKLIIATNSLPETTDKTLGFYRRWTIIDFPNQFSEAKDILSEIPEEEYHSLALKIPILLRGILERRNFTNEGTIEERIKAYESKSDYLTAFIQEFTEEDVNGIITLNQFNKKFGEWCDEKRHRKMSDISVGKALRKIGWDKGTKNFDWLHDGKGGYAKVWLGVRWKE